MRGNVIIFKKKNKQFISLQTWNKTDKKNQSPIANYKVLQIE